MDLHLVTRVNEYTWRIEPKDQMRVPGIIYASRELIEQMDHKVYEQVCNVASLPGIVRASYAMPDAHWGYGFPIGGVAAFDPEQGGVISAGGVGFDISCGVRLLRTDIETEDLMRNQEFLADELFAQIPAGVGRRGQITLDDFEMDAMLLGGARWAIQQGYGEIKDLERIEEQGSMVGASPREVSPRARERQRSEMGTLGSGNHYLEVQRVSQIDDATAARALGISLNQIVISIHCGSRGLGHQIGSEFLREMALEDRRLGLAVPDRELACAPVGSQVAVSYLGAMKAATNCALANREILTHITRQVFKRFFPDQTLELVYDVSHNTCKEEWHSVDGQQKRLFVHRKGATRALGPGHPDLPETLKPIGQPVFIGGSMGTGSYILIGTATSESQAFSSACHGSGRSMSRSQALKVFHGDVLVRSLQERGILIRSSSFRGVAEEAPDAYKDIDQVASVAEAAGLAKRVARLSPLICIKG